MTAQVKLRSRYRLPRDPRTETFADDQVCLKCGAGPGWRCWDARSALDGPGFTRRRRQAVRPHPERRWLSTCRSCPIGCRTCTQDDSDCGCYQHA